MRTIRLLFSLTCVVTAGMAQVTITKAPDRIRVEMDGKAFGELYFGADAAKPYFYPLRAPSGTIVTRQFPMVQDSGETKDHLHHRGLWAGYIVVNGFNFWENEASYHRANAGKVVMRSVDEVTSGARSGTLRATFDWRDPTGNTILTEKRTMIFAAEPTLRTIDVGIALTAVTKAAFGDDKDGTLGVRMADPLTEKQGGVITNAQGKRTMKEAWGKRSEWVDYSGEIQGEKLGIAIFDHPSSFHHPTRWHSRDYGLLAANPFGSQAYDKEAPLSEVTLEPAKSVQMRYLVVVHGAMQPEAVGQLYQRWISRR